MGGKYPPVYPPILAMGGYTPPRGGIPPLGGPLLLKNNDVLDGYTVFHIFSYFLQILLYTFEILSKVAFQ